MPSPTLRSAIAHINRHGALLVFPIKNKREPASLWSCFHPRSTMQWDWSEDSDGRVATLWHLRERLSRTGDVVYSKWYKGRATFFSRSLFTALLSLVSTRSVELGGEPQLILKTLQDDSPLASRQLRSLSGFEGKDHSRAYEKALRELWQRFLIVGYGEVDEGGYPSLAIGSSTLLFEEAWENSKNISDSERRQTLIKYFTVRSEFYGYYMRIERTVLRSAYSPP